MTPARPAALGSLSGTVTDPVGASISGANVTVRNNATGAERNTTSKDDGSFVFPTLDPGSYSVMVSAAR